MPIALMRALKATPNALSLSRMRYFGALSHGNASVIWRANHSAVGFLGHRKPQQLPPAMAKNKKCIELLKGNRRNHKQINRRNPLHMVAKEGLPSLQWPISPRHHVDRDRGLSDLDAELEQLAMDLGGAPKRVLQTHSSDQVAYPFADPRSATERTGPPSPVGADAHSMPTHDRVGPDYG